MEGKWVTRAKKLALAFETGWQYMPGSDEAGSVLTDIFLEMAGKNDSRLERIWEKHELEFLQAAPNMGKEAETDCRGALLVAASGEEDGKRLEEGVLAYTLGEQGELHRFRTSCPLQLTAARLRCAVYRRGMWAWLTYGGEEERGSVALFQPVGETLAHPVFRWRFYGLCDGRKEFRFRMDFGGEESPVSELCGNWAVDDGDRSIPICWRQTESGCFLEGQVPEFAGNLSPRSYLVSLTFSEGREPLMEWLRLLCGEFFLTEEPREWEPEFCLTDSGVCCPERVLPFGASLEESACLYLSCDGIPEGNGLSLLFRESFLEEERLPEPQPEEYRKLYRKYPWLQRNQTVQEWRPEETRWEYFNGNRWRTLPGSEAWNTGCGSEGGERAHAWSRPADMQPCMVDGEEHFYIRLCLVRVSNAYAAFYRKRIPVLEAIRFTAGERREAFCFREVPDLSSAAEEKMYLGFDREVSPHSRWYMGTGAWSFEAGQLKGKEVLFGREAFWVELTEKREETLQCLLPNYVQIRQMPGEEEEEKEIRIEAGTRFYLEPRHMGLLEAVCPEGICRGERKPPEILGKTAAEHGFAHFGRILTPLDLELMLQERFPFLRVNSCVFHSGERCLKVEISADKEEWNRKVFRTAQERRRELSLTLPEVQGWLGETMSTKGPLWLRGCRVKCTVQEGRI